VSLDNIVSYLFFLVKKVELLFIERGRREHHGWLLFLCFFVAHELESVDLLKLGDDELSPHVRDFHLELLDLQVSQFDGVFQVVLLILAGHPSLVVFFDNC